MRFMRLVSFVWITSLLFVSYAVAGDRVPAKKLFGKVAKPSKQKSNSYGSYAKGCLAGAKMLPANGPAWQAMRLHRNRNWAHPKMVDLVMKIATDAQKVDGWPGLLVGDLAQPRGGPMITGHASHQVGLDADIWLRPLPKKRFTKKQQYGANISAISMIKRGKDRKWTINEKHWKPGHVKLLKRAATSPGVARIFIHPAIKKALCQASDKDKSWLKRVRPWWGHHYHFHIRMNCPTGSVGCQNQPAPPSDHGCGKQLDYWLKLVNPRVRKKVTVVKKNTKKIKKKKVVRKRQVVLADLPNACRVVLGKDNIPSAVARKKVPLPVRRPKVLTTKTAG
ncbi:MAG: penicillin-insensitive murein endopeptidase [Methyloligellaceae bacterium]